MDSNDNGNFFWMKCLPFKGQRKPERTATPYWMYHMLNQNFLRGLRSGRFNLKRHEQFNGFLQIGPMNAYQFMDCERVLEDHYEETVEA